MSNKSQLHLLAGVLSLIIGGGMIFLYFMPLYGGELISFTGYDMYDLYRNVSIDFIDLFDKEMSYLMIGVPLLGAFLGLVEIGRGLYTLATGSRPFVSLMAFLQAALVGSGVYLFIRFEQLDGGFLNALVPRPMVGYYALLGLALLGLIFTLTIKTNK